MTRVNLCEPIELTDQHLIAEYREIKSIFAMALAAQNKGWTPDHYNIAKTYHLNKGHMTFFVNKLKFLHRRYLRLVKEAKRRGFQITRHNIKVQYLRDIQRIWWGDWEPSQHEIDISNARIAERIRMKPSFYRYRGIPLTELKGDEK